MATLKQTNFCFLILILFGATRGIYEKGLDDMPQQNNPLKLFSSLDIVMDTLLMKQLDMPLQVDLVTKAFTATCVGDANLTLPLTSKMPFIVVEGNTVIDAMEAGKNLAMILNARFINMPPPCLRQFAYLFQKGTTVRRAYFALSRYAAAYQPCK
uniref:Uncharacterized protein n=1 Tax=Clastoptera arizonana TaxID=38151 RepID=A0A1B6C2B2_9HEMI